MTQPCISTNCAGSNEIIVDGENGLLVPIGDEELLIKSMIRLINDKKLARCIGINASKSTKSLRRESILKKWEETIEIN